MNNRKRVFDQNLKGKASSGISLTPPGKWLFNRVAKSMLSLDYDPPERDDQICDHLTVLWHCYKTLYDFPLTLIDMRLDLSFGKLMGEANYVIREIIDLGPNYVSRTKKSAKVKRAKSDKKKHFVCDIYHRGETIQRGLNLNTVAKTIQKRFVELQEIGRIPRDVKRPSTDQIKRYLKEDDKIWADFKQKGRYWILQ